jgi:hypothetical protein
MRARGHVDRAYSPDARVAWIRGVDARMRRRGVDARMRRRGVDAPRGCVDVDARRGAAVAGRGLTRASRMCRDGDCLVLLHCQPLQVAPSLLL